MQMIKRKIKITQIKDNKKSEKSDIVLIEKPVNIYLNNNHLVSIICLPESIKELAVGFLFSIGLIDDLTDIVKIEPKQGESHNIFIQLTKDKVLSDQDLKALPMGRVIETASGTTPSWRKIIKGTLREEKRKSTEGFITVHSKVIFSALRQLQTETLLFRKTGGCHGAALFSFEGDLLSLKEDIGRHNAIDKVIGAYLLANKKPEFSNMILTSTGRLTGDSVLKATRAGFKIMASVSAAIESGIQLAHTHNLTLIGFVREERMNVYTHSERIVV